MSENEAADRRAIDEIATWLDQGVEIAREALATNDGDFGRTVANMAQTLAPVVEAMGADAVPRMINTVAVAITRMATAATGRTHTSLRLDYAEMARMLNMMNISVLVLERAKASDDGQAAVGAFTVRRTRLEGLFTLTISLPAERKKGGDDADG